MEYLAHLDEIDQWLRDSFGIIPGACASMECLRHDTARMVAEALWPKVKDSKKSEEIDQNFTKPSDFQEFEKQYMKDKEGEIVNIYDRHAGLVDGAKWQKKQDQETIELAEDHAMLAGRMQMKEELMNEAVEADVNTYEEQPSGMSYVELVVDIPASRMKKKEKARIIILKDDEEG